MNGSKNTPPPPPTPSDGSDDERVDEMLIHAARDYNLPGEVPREEIWAKISEARRAATAAAPGATPLRAPSKGRSVWFGPGVGIAAALLISTGVVIGRQMSARDNRTATTAVRPSTTTAAATDGTTPGTTPGTTSGATSAVPATTVAATATQDTLQEQLHRETRRTNDAARALAAADTRDPSAADAARDPRRAATANLAYQLVVMRHLAGTEAMITSFQQSARRGVHDSTMAEWSRELLSTTRTLEAARSTNDPMMRRLLDDLDLVLSQIVLYTTKGTTNPDELDLIEQSINRRGIMMKLRSNLPARQMPMGT